MLVLEEGELRLAEVFSWKDNLVFTTNNQISFSAHSTRFTHRRCRDLFDFLQWYVVHEFVLVEQSA